VSNRQIPAVTDKFKLWTKPCMGMKTRRSECLMAYSLRPACSLPNSQASFGSVSFALYIDSESLSSTVATVVYPWRLRLAKHFLVESNMVKSNHLLAEDDVALPTFFGLNFFCFSKIKNTFWIPNASQLLNTAAALCGSYTSSITTAPCWRRWATSFNFSFRSGLDIRYQYKK